MDHRRAGFAVIAVLLAGLALAATQGPPAYVYTGAAPTGACWPPRVWIDALGAGTYYCNAGVWTAVVADTGTPGGADTQVQFNDGGAFGGSPELTWNKTTLKLTLGAASQLLLPASTAAAAPLHITSGVPPTAPQSGDIWMENNVLFAFGGNGAMSLMYPQVSLNALGSPTNNSSLSLGAWAHTWTWNSTSSGATPSWGHYVSPGTLALGGRTWMRVSVSPGSGATYGTMLHLDSTLNSLSSATYKLLELTTKAPTDTAISSTGVINTAYLNVTNAPTICAAGDAAGGINGSLNATGCFTPAAGTPYVLPDATDLVTGGLRLTGDLGGTATAPTVPGLAGKAATAHAHTTTEVSGLDAGADFTTGVLPQAQGGMGAASLTCAGTDKVTCNGTVCTCSADLIGGGVDLSASEFVTFAANANLSAERVLTAGTNTTIDTATAGQIKVNVSGLEPAGAYSGIGTCTNQFARALNDTAAPTCAGVGVADFTANQGATTQVLHGNATGQPVWAAVNLSTDTGATALPATKGGTGLTTTTAGGILYGAAGNTITSMASGASGDLLYNSGAATPAWLPVVGAGAMLVSAPGGPKYLSMGGVGSVMRATGTGDATPVGVTGCTSAASTTCTVAVRSGCYPVCGLGTAVSTWVKGTVVSTTMTCTFSTSGTNNCRCFCP